MTTNHPRRRLPARWLIQLTAAVALIATATAVAIGDSPANNPTTAAATQQPQPATAGAGDEYRHRLQIPSLDVDAPIVAVNVDDDGVLGIPADPNKIGWWSNGPPPGTPQGTSILAGHVNTPHQGPGALSKLDQIEPGAQIIIDGWGTTPRTYTVDTIQQHPRGAIPTHTFDQHRQERLAIVSCTDLNQQTGEYRLNLVIIATPTTSPH